MKKIFITTLILLTAAVAFAQTSISVEAPNVVAADEQFNVTFIIEGEDSPTDFTWTSSDDFQIQWGPQQGKSTSIQIMNGKRTKSVQSTYTYVLRCFRHPKRTTTPSMFCLRANLPTACARPTAPTCLRLPGSTKWPKR